MFERFTDRARQTMALANDEAHRLNHAYMGTEHILLGLVREGSGVGANVLKNLAVDLSRVRQEVEQRVERGPTPINQGKLPQTSEGKKVIEWAIREARELNHNYVGTEHILLGLLRQENSIAGQVLVAFGLEPNQVREATLGLLGEGRELERVSSTEGKEEALTLLLDGHQTLSAAISAAVPHLTANEPVTPGRFVLALIEADPALASRLAPIMGDIRKACTET